MLTRKAFLLSVSFLLSLSAMPASAAEGFSIECTNKKCGYHEMLLLGPAMMGERVTGYCRRCKKIVSICWKQDGESQGPASVSRTTAVPTGERKTWKCPDCGKPFTEIKEPEDIKQCPRCHSKTTGWEQPVMAAD